MYEFPITFQECSIKDIRRSFWHRMPSKCNDSNWSGFISKSTTSNIDYEYLLRTLRQIGNGTHVIILTRSNYVFKNKTITCVIIRRNQYTTLIALFLKYDIPLNIILSKKKELGL